MTVTGAATVARRGTTIVRRGREKSAKTAAAAAVVVPDSGTAIIRRVRLRTKSVEAAVVAGQDRGTAAGESDSEQRWWWRAACRSFDTEAWFPDHAAGAAFAQRICTGCPVRTECGWDAHRSGEMFGVRAAFRMDRAAGRRELRTWLGIRETTPPVKLLRKCLGCGDSFETDDERVRSCARCAKYCPAGPVNERLGQLYGLGWTPRRVSLATGVASSTLVQLRDRTQLTRAVAGKIMALELTAYGEVMAQ